MRGKVTIIVGGQFGSEAKGKVFSFLPNEFDVAVRAGSPNSGYTVFKDKEIFSLRQIPVTFLNPDCVLCIGAGALIDTDVLREEVDNTGTKDRLFIDSQAGIIEKNIFLEKRI